MPKESKSSLKPIAAKRKTEEVHEGIQTFLRVAYLKRKGILKENFWPFELDTPTTVISILADYLVLLHYNTNSVSSLKRKAWIDDKISAFLIIVFITYRWFVLF